jgi:RNA polymerase sigma-70 factor (ECF subfamily)
MSTRTATADLFAQASEATAALPTPFDDLAVVIETHRPRVYRFLLASVRDADLAETLTQETFLARASAATAPWQPG